MAAASVDQLAFLHEFAQLATQARDWDELMRTLVDRTTLALGVEVCSFYLLNRDGERLTLAATNGLDVDAGRPRQPGARRGDHRARGGRAHAGDVARRHHRPALLVGPRLRHPRAARDAVDAARLERGGRRRAQRPDARDPRVHARGPGVPLDDRGAPRRHRREGPHAGRGGGAARPPVAAGRGSRGAARGRHPRAADAARRRPRVRRPARRCRGREHRRVRPSTPSRTGGPAPRTR